MQPNSEKQTNNYSSEGVYPPYQAAAPPPYSTYPQAPLHQQRKIVVVPIHRNVSNNKQLIPITNSLKTFLLLSGFIYSLWGILAFSIHIAIIVNSYSTYYYGLFTGFFLVFGGIIMMVIGLRPSYPMNRLIRMYVVTLMLCILGLISSIINYTLSTRCSSVLVRYCDDDLGSNLKISLIITFSLSVIHTAINLFYVPTEQKRAISRSNADIINY